MQNGMEMVWHQAILEKPNFRVKDGNPGKIVNDGFTEIRTLDKCLCWVILGNLEFAEERFTGWYHQNHVVDTNSMPCVTIFLPMPIVVHLLQI